MSPSFAEKKAQFKNKNANRIAASLKNIQNRAEAINSQAAANQEQALSKQLQSIALEKIECDDNQPRKTFSGETITELAESIKANGLLQPINVYQLPDGRYRIKSGERRWRACRELGMKFIDAIVEREVTSGERQIEQLVENIHREDMNAFDIGCAIRKALEVDKLDVKAVRERLAMPKRKMNRYLRIATADERLAELIRTGRIIDMNAMSIILTALQEKPEYRELINDAIDALLAQGEDTVVTLAAAKAIAAKIEAAEAQKLAAEKGEPAEEDPGVTVGEGLTMFNAKEVLRREKMYRKNYTFLKPMPILINCLVRHHDLPPEGVFGCEGAQVLLNVKNNASDDYALVEFRGKLYSMPWCDIAITGTTIIEDPKKSARAAMKAEKENVESIEERARRLEDDAEGDEHAQ